MVMMGKVFKKVLSPNEKDMYWSKKGGLKNEQDNPKLRKLKQLSFWRRNFYKTANYLILADLAFVFLLPFLYMIITSLKTDADLVDTTVKWIPTTICIENYVRAFRALDYVKHLKNSVLVTGLCTAGHVFSCSLAGYSLAKYRYYGRNLFFTFVILSIITPIQVILLPLYLRYGKLNMLGTYLPLILPTFFGYGLSGALFIFIYRQYFLGIPQEFIEAAKIDGCGFISTFYRVVFPTSKSPTLVTTVLSLIWHWNDYFEPTFYIRRSHLHLLSQKLPNIYHLFQQAGKFDPVTQLQIKVYNEAVFMAAIFLVVLPLLVIYIVLQRQFVEGIERTGHVE
ncbi:MAG TPA: carbohydrate ABC transporter permease [Clostridiales bacterium]|mgnify:CR=1 FL=1|nr:carbohydrate ABC transporter permease [Clostridiales bacterium]